MSPEEFLAGIRKQVVGEPVSFRRLAANSLLVYVGCQPGEKKGIIFWFEPTWHLRGPERVLTGSRQAQHDEKEPEPAAGFDAAAAAVDLLLDRTVESVEVEPVTNSLILNLSGGYQARTFVSDPTDSQDWYITEKSTGLCVEGCAAGLAVRQRGRLTSAAADQPAAGG